MKLERVFDVSVIEAVIGHPEIKPLVYEGDVSLPSHENIYYLLATDADKTLGVVCFIPVNSIAWNPHIAVLPEHRGCGTELMAKACWWMFDNTPCLKVVAYPPAYNAAMIRVFEKCGFTKEGFSPQSFMFKGVIHDRLLFGLGKG